MGISIPSKRAAAVAVVVVLGAAGAFYGWGYVNGVQKRVIHASPIMNLVGGPGDTVRASSAFAILRDNAKGIPSDGTGGACLVGDLRRFGYPEASSRECSNDSECHEIGKQNHPELYNEVQGWTGYCVRRQCYTRPGTQPAMCNVDKDNPRPDGKWLRVPKDGDIDLTPIYRIVGNQRPIHWAIHACLNGTTNGSSNRDCADLNKHDKLTDDSVGYAY